MKQSEIAKQLIRDESRLLAYVWSIVRDVHVAEDIFQDVVAAAIERYSEIRDAEHLGGWARIASRFAALNYLRDNRRHVPSPDLVQLIDDNWKSVDQLDQEEYLNALQHCLQNLTPRARRIIHLRYAEGLQGRQVAKRLGQKVQTTYQALARIHRKLSDCIRLRLNGESAS